MQEDPWPRLRPANNKDCEKVRELVFCVLKEYNLKPDPVATDADIKDIEYSYFERGGTFYVLEEKDGSIIGAYGLYPLDRQMCELRKRICRIRAGAFIKQVRPGVCTRIRIEVCDM